MEELVAKAGKYAADKSKDLITNAIAQAYADGYRDGYNDCEKVVSVNLNDTNVEYVDLGLPSGTLWASDYVADGKNIKYLAYEEVAELALPTKEQIQELFDYCIWDLYKGKREKYGFICIGPNQKHITFDFCGRRIPAPVNSIIDRYWHAYFWVKGQYEGEAKNAVHLKRYVDNLGRKVVQKEFEEYKTGIMIPLRLVSSSEL